MSWGHIFFEFNGIYLRSLQLLMCLSKALFGEGNGNPLQCSCLENPRDRGVWWAAVYGVAQSRTRLKRLSSSSKQGVARCQNGVRKAFNMLPWPTVPAQPAM